jgi:hypothetical protein
MTLFLVRLRLDYRFPESYFEWRRSTHPCLQQAFSTRQQAENYCAAELPLWQNPFDSAAINLDTEDDLVIFLRVFTWEALDAELVALGLTPPVRPHTTIRFQTDDEQEIKQALIDWWDETAPRMTDTQKAALWRLLDPQPWEIVEVELEETP